MIVKVNVNVRPKSYKGSFIVKLLEVDTFKDDLLAQKVEHLNCESMGYLRDREVPEVVEFEFFVSALSFVEFNAELKVLVESTEGHELGESSIVDFSFTKDFIQSGAKTLTLPEVVI